MKLKVKKKTSYMLTGLRAKHIEYLIKALTHVDVPHETEEEDIKLIS